MIAAENERNDFERNGSDRLDGWKEISNYLNCDVRTCLRWEKDLGLPVIRINKESKRSKVIAYKANVDRWLAGGKRLDAAAAAPKKWGFPIWKVVIGAAVVLAVAGAEYWLLFSRPSSGPVNWKLKGQTLVFMDTRDREIWDIEIDSSQDQERSYHDPPIVDSQGKALGRKWDRPKVAFMDIDHDGKREVICYLNHEDPLSRSIALVDHNGKKLWEKTLEYRESYPKGAPTHDFRLYQVSLEDINGDGAIEILSLWGHDRDFPGVFEVRSLAGDRLYQYDHTGILQFFVVSHDPAGRTAKEILLGGTNNLLGGDAVLIILDCADLKSGLGPPYTYPPELQTRETELETFVPATAQRASQKHYLRFRHNQLSAVDPLKYLNVTEIHASSEGLLIQVKYSLDAFLYFRFDSGKRLLSVSLGADSERTYQDLFVRKKVSLTPEAFLREAEKDVLAWDGEGWVPVPTFSR
ncbi:MAG: hypothetical protein NTU60_12745 [Candidatus Aminicenantes bacterium]|nr:hypothetical protein [Candidatus Aminicenantes bacterium]